MDNQKELDEFIARAGFTYGWRNLESWARRMAEQAVEELADLRRANLELIRVNSEQRLQEQRLDLALKRATTKEKNHDAN